MKTMINILILPSLLSTTLFSMERTYDEAKNVALNFANMLQPSVGFTIDDTVLSKPVTSKILGNVKKERAFQIIKLKPQGWVMLSNDDIAKPILGYNLDKTFDLSHIAPEFIHWANGIDDEISIESHKRAKGKRTYQSQWDSLSKDRAIYKETKLYTKRSRLGVSHTGELSLMPDIQWGQNKPYNTYIPKHDLVGCSATAIAQIMAYHKWPMRGFGSYSYYHPIYGEIAVNFDNLYNWYSMGDLDKALISYHVGVTMNMIYSHTLSTAWPVPNKLRKHFGYEMSNLLAKKNDTDLAWEKKIKDSLDEKRPVWYSGDNLVGGHAFVIDGYKFDEESKMYHINFGWSGYSNGWYELSALKAFNDKQHAIFDMRPNNDPSFGGLGKVTIFNLKTKRFLFSKGSLKSTEKWVNKPTIIGTDSNDNHRGDWELLPYNEGYHIINLATKRYLFLSADVTDFSEENCTKETPQIMTAKSDEEGNGEWRLIRTGVLNNPFKIQHAQTGRYLFQSGSIVEESEDGWVKSPNVVGLGSHKDEHKRATWNLTLPKI